MSVISTTSDLMLQLLREKINCPGGAAANFSAEELIALSKLRDKLQEVFGSNPPAAAALAPASTTTTPAAAAAAAVLMPHVPPPVDSRSSRELIVGDTAEDRMNKMAYEANPVPDDVDEDELHWNFHLRNVRMIGDDVKADLINDVLEGRRDLLVQSVFEFNKKDAGNWKHYSPTMTLTVRSRWARNRLLERQRRYIGSRDAHKVQVLAGFRATGKDARPRVCPWTRPQGTLCAACGQGHLADRCPYPPAASTLEGMDVAEQTVRRQRDTFRCDAHLRTVLFYKNVETHYETEIKERIWHIMGADSTSSAVTGNVRVERLADSVRVNIDPWTVAAARAITEQKYLFPETDPQQNVPPLEIQSTHLTTSKFIQPRLAGGQGRGRHERSAALDDDDDSESDDRGGARDRGRRRGGRSARKRRGGRSREERNDDRGDSGRDRGRGDRGAREREDSRRHSARDRDHGDDRAGGRRFDFDDRRPMRGRSETPPRAPPPAAAAARGFDDRYDASGGPGAGGGGDRFSHFDDRRGAGPPPPPPPRRDNYGRNDDPDYYGRGPGSNNLSQVPPAAEYQRQSGESRFDERYY